MRRAEKDASAGRGGGGPLLYGVEADEEYEEVEEAVDEREDDEKGEGSEDTVGEVVDGVETERGEDAVAVGDSGDVMSGEGSVAATEDAAPFLGLVDRSEASGSSEIAVVAVVVVVDAALSSVCSARPFT